jgi:hypothetical protein
VAACTICDLVGISAQAGDEQAGRDAASHAVAIETVRVSVQLTGYDVTQTDLPLRSPAVLAGKRARQNCRGWPAGLGG